MSEVPFIPEHHRQYDLLPLCRKNGGEVFDYPSRLMDEAARLLGSCEYVMPYGYQSYAAYDAALDALMQRHAVNPALAAKLAELKEAVHSMNRKEEWSVLAYIGPTDEHVLGLTHGRNYYWPTRQSNPVYRGVIDDEEFTAYLYPTDASLWLILEDPTGMAARTIYHQGQGHLAQPAWHAMMKAVEDGLNRLPDGEKKDP